MSVALRLKKSEDEIAAWPLVRIQRWMALFKIQNEEQEKALERAKRNRGHFKG